MLVISFLAGCAAGPNGNRRGLGLQSWCFSWGSIETQPKAKTEGTALAHEQSTHEGEYLQASYIYISIYDTYICICIYIYTYMSTYLHLDILVLLEFLHSCSRVKTVSKLRLTHCRPSVSAHKLLSCGEKNTMNSISANSKQKPNELPNNRKGAPGHLFRNKLHVSKQVSKSLPCK